LIGRKIVDINHLFLTLKSIKQQGFDCSFYDVDIINEKRYGLKSYFSYKCTICGLEGTFSSEPDTVIVDGAWSKRSYKTNYNALSGVASIIGARSKKVLYIGIKNKYCRICEKFAKLKKSTIT
jgi:hypothetical protein